MLSYPIRMKLWAYIELDSQLAIFREPEVENIGTGCRNDLVRKLVDFCNASTLFVLLFFQTWKPQKSFFSEHVYIVVHMRQNFSKVSGAFPG